VLDVVEYLAGHGHWLMSTTPPEVYRHPEWSAELNRTHPVTGGPMSVCLLRDCWLLEDGYFYSLPYKHHLLDADELLSVAMKKYPRVARTRYPLVAM